MIALLVIIAIIFVGLTLVFLAWFNKYKDGKIYFDWYFQYYCHNCLRDVDFYTNICPDCGACLIGVGNSQSIRKVLCLSWNPFKWHIDTEVK